jgi:hypothetical protein
MNYDQENLFEICIIDYDYEMYLQVNLLQENISPKVQDLIDKSEMIGDDNEETKILRLKGYFQRFQVLLI